MLYSDPKQAILRKMPTTPIHPLDPLTADEIERVAAAVSARAEFGAQRFITIELREPGSEEQPHKTALEWGVRVMGRAMTMRRADGDTRTVTGDFFPAYDDDGGLLAVLTPRTV